MTAKKLTSASLSAAVIFAVTWTVRLPVPATSGAYINLGDAVIFLVSYLLGGPAAAGAAAVGSALADLAAGAGVYIPATFAIKGCMALVCGLLSRGKGFSPFILSCVTGSLIMVSGYALYELLLFGPAYAAAALPFNFLQAGGSCAVSAVFFPAAGRLYALYSR